MLDRHLVVRQQAHEINEEAARYDDSAVPFDLRLEGRAQRQLHVGRGEVQAAGFCAKQDTGKDLHSRACRNRTCNDTELLRELLALSNDFHPRPYHGVGFNHLKNLVVVIGDVDAVDEAPLPGG
jgi:hypothetical protein